MDNTDILVFTLFVVPSFIVFVFLTLREFGQAGKSSFNPESDKRLS
mgnify:CR=1 FL=1|jgi:hypothetical protein